MNFIKLQSHDSALMWDRFKRMLAVMSCMMIVAIFEWVIGRELSMEPHWYATIIAAIVGQLIVLQCWVDIVCKRKPGKNCWEFGRD